MRSATDVKEDAAAIPGTEVVYDPWRATQLAHQLAKDGATGGRDRPDAAKNMASAFDELLSL